MGFISLVLLLVFQGQDIAQFWTTDAQSSGHYYQETFFKSAPRNPQTSLSALQGKRISSTDTQVVYQFAVPLNARVYLQPTLVQDSPLYKQLNTLHLVFPGKQDKQQLFHGATHSRQRLEITSYLKDRSLFQVVLDNADQRSTGRVIGGLEIFVVNQKAASELPHLPLLLLLWAAPFLGCWFATFCLGFSPSLALGLNALHLLMIHILGILEPGVASGLLLAETLTVSGLLLLKSLTQGRSLPTAPLCWMVLLPGVYLRWQEILIQFAQPLFENPVLKNYYLHGIAMDLFTERGFFGALYPQGPLYPFLIKITGMIFGFSLLHMFYLSLVLSLLLILLTALLTHKLTGSRWSALAVSLLLSLNPFLIQESTLQRPDVLGACIALGYFYLVFSRLKGSMLYGFLRGLLLLGLVWTHLSFAPLALLLLTLDVFYQRQRLKSGLLSLLLILVGVGPGLYQNWQVYRSFLPESTYYVSRVANYTFSGQESYPAAMDVLRFDQQAPNYRSLSIREYFLKEHKPLEILGASALGVGLILMDSVGALWHLSSGENILDRVIYGLTSAQNMLPTLALLLLEVLLVLFLGAFAWLRYRRYRVLLSMLLLWMLPYSFFHGIFLIKGYANWQFMLDHQILLICVPLLTLISVDAVRWLTENRQRWLR